MSDPKTVPRERKGMPVTALRVEVLAGPDAELAHTADGDTLTIGTAEGNDVRLTDPTVSRFHLQLRRKAHRVEVKDLGSTNGTWVGPALLRAGAVDVGADTELLLGDTRIKVSDGDVLMLEPGPSRVDQLLAASPSMRQILAQVAKVATSDVSVLITGESGTGKELIARAIHSQSARAEEPFVTVDCGAVSRNLFASELFGHERGAFTGAERQHAGAFERAHGGTIFLDEIGELPAELQSSLLGALERRRVRRLGGSEEIAVDVRVLSATHRDLRAAVNEGWFRLDLYYRLAVVPIHVPPLRERPEDVAMLTEHFLREAGHQGRVDDVLDRETLQAFRRHPWPGNARELRNAVLGALALGVPPELYHTRQDSDVETGGWEQLLPLPYREAKRTLLDAFERKYLSALLEGTGGNIRQASRDAQMDRSYLMELLKRHGMR